jgi:transcriptional regulator with XRE-family HTH domain
MFSPQRLEALRSERDLTRSQLHAALVLLGRRPCRAMLDRWEAGVVEPRASDLEGLARALQAPIEDFFDQVTPQQ